MVIALFRRRLKEGKTFADFKAAWEAEKGFGVPARVIAATRLDDPREVLTVGFVDIEPKALSITGEAVAEQEAARHGRIDEVIESTELRAFYAVESEHDFSSEPREIAAGDPASILSGL
jgi:hypothetical protein